MKKGNVAIIVVTFNRKNLLRENLKAILDNAYHDYEVLIIDNCSTDGTYEYIEDLLNNSTVFYYRTEKNIGGAGGFNFGMKKAYQHDCEYMWLMDDDCIVHRDSLTVLLHQNDVLSGNYGFLSSKVLWKDRTLCKMNVQKKNIFQKNQDWQSPIVPIHMATFVSFFIPTRIVLDVGLPISDFFIWADAFEYSRRISKKYQCYLINDSVVTHKSKDNIGSNLAIDENENLSRYSYAYRNEYYIYHRENIFGKLYYVMKILYHKLNIYRSHSQRKCEKISIINKAIKEAYEFTPQIEYLVKDKLSK